MVEVVFNSTPRAIQLGENTDLALMSAAQAATSADDAAQSAAYAAQSAAYAGGFETPEYASQAAGNAATTAGQIFRVPLGTTPQTFNWYRRLASGSELVSPLATAADVGKTLASWPLLNVAKDATSDVSSAINSAIASQGVVEFPAYPSGGRYGVTGGLSIARSNVHLRFQNGAALIPVGTAPGQMIDIRGSEPTSWTALSADAYQNACVISTAIDPGWQVGDWLEIRSNKIIDSTPNIFGDAVGDCHKIAQKFGTGPYQFVFNEPLCDNFLVADSAVAGKATILENIVIENPQFNDEDFANIIGFSIRAQYCTGLKIIRPRGFGSKTPFAADNPAGDFIKLINCIEPYIEEPQMTHGAYYGLSILGWTRGLKSYGGTLSDLRHSVSLVHQTQSVIGTPGRIQKYGQPSDILIHGMTARNTSLSSFDTHDTGLNIRFENCVAYGSGDDGFQFRTHKVKAINCYANGSQQDGFSVDDMIVSSTPGSKYGALDCELINCRALNNGRMGANLRYNSAVVRGGEYINNGSTRSRPAMVYPPTSAPAGQGVVQAGACGIRINGGIIDGASIQGNAGSGGANGSAIIYGDFAASGVASAQVSMRPLELRGLVAPASALQTSFISLGAANLDFGLITLAGGNQIDGYGDSLFNNLGTIDNKPPMSRGGNHITIDASKRRGEATLIGGQVFVPNTAARNKAAAAFSEAIVSKIALTRMTPAGICGSLYVKSIVDGVGFTVASTAFSEPTRTNVIRNNTNVGAANGALGSPGVLPTNWGVLGAASGLATTIVGTGSEIGPGGGVQNYIDIRINGTTSGALNYGFYFDTASNAAAAAVLGETWTGSFGVLMTAGSTANLTGVRCGIGERSSAGALLVSAGTTFTPPATKQRVVYTRALSQATVAFVHPYIQFIASTGAVIDITLRLYMPQLEKAADNSAPIATSGSAVTRTVDMTISDNSSFEWTMTV